MLLKKKLPHIAVLLCMLGLAACQEQTPTQEAHEEMKGAVDDFADEVDEIITDNGGQEEMLDAVEDFTDDIEDATDELGEDVQEAGEQIQQKFDE